MAKTDAAAADKLKGIIVMVKTEYCCKGSRLCAASTSVLRTNPNVLLFPVGTLTLLLITFSLVRGAVNDAFSSKGRVLAARAVTCGFASSPG